MNTDSESITLSARHHDKLGMLHCGVTRAGFVAVGGDVADITDGGKIEFPRHQVTVERKGDEYTFTRHG